MSSDPEIRVYTAADQDGVIALWRQVFPGESGWNEPADVIARKLTVQPDLFFVAVQDRQVVGTVMAGFDGVRGWVHKLAVHPEAQRRGLASRLMHRAEQGLRNLGCAKLNLQVRASNLQVIAFYESLGFSVEDRASLGKPLE